MFIGVYLGVEVISRIGVGYGEEARLAIGYFRFIEERERERRRMADWRAKVFRECLCVCWTWVMDYDRGGRRVMEVWRWWW